MNPLIDISFFEDLMAEFEYEYDWFFVTGTTTDDLGHRTYKYSKGKIMASIQDDGVHTDRRKDGNVTYHRYSLYCLTRYKINRNDIIYYNNEYLLVNDDVVKYNEYGVMSCTLVSVDQSLYRDLLEPLRSEVSNYD